MIPDASVSYREQKYPQDAGRYKRGGDAIYLIVHNPADIYPRDKQFPVSEFHHYLHQSSTVHFLPTAQKNPPFPDTL